MARVTIQASEVHVAAKALVNVAQSVAKKPKDREKQALLQLEQFTELADRFRQTVQGAFHEPERTEAAYRELVEGYVAVLQSLPALQRQPRVFLVFEDVTAAMDSVAPYYGGYPQEYASQINALLTASRDQ